MKTPYTDLPATSFHSKCMKGSHPSLFDPIVSTKFSVSRSEKIMTMGSCFAQNLSKWLIKNGYNFYRKEIEKYETGGIFSANYGNVYTVRQALQLYKRAMGLWKANNEVYQNEHHRFFDPLRPSCSTSGYESEIELIESRSEHELSVKSLFEEADVLVFTLGLTEAWIRNSDEAVLPIAPGVVAGDYNKKDYSFKNFTYQEILDDLNELISKLHAVNPSCKVLLTVSPVPLAATYEEKHVALASMTSKAVLRAVVDEIYRNYDFVDYFPSFEVFFTPGIGTNYFEYDARHVKQTGVSHAMRLFAKHYANRCRVEENIRINSGSLVQDKVQLVADLHNNVHCDEDQIG